MIFFQRNHEINRDYKRGFLLYSQDLFIVRLQNERDSFIAKGEGLPPPQILVRLVFRASSGLVVAPTTMLQIWQRKGLGERSDLAINKSCALQ